MARSPDPDAWLDAFDPTELEDPELAALDQAVDRLAGSRAPAPSRLAPLAVGMVMGALMAAAVFAALTPLVAERPATERAVAEPTPAEPVIAEQPAPAPPPSPVEGMARAPMAPRPSPPEVLSPPSPAPPSPPLELPLPVHRPGPGLLPGKGAQLVVEAGVATLSEGLLTYVHDEDHEPGVREVDLASLPISLQPVGTAFSAHARPYVGAVRVTSGKVRVVHDDGTLLAELGPGQEAVGVTDLGSSAEVRVIHTTGLPLDALAAQLPSDCLCHPRDVIASVASLRLATRSHQEAP